MVSIGSGIKLDSAWPDLDFSRRTLLNFLAAFFFLAGFLTAMNSPPFLLRLVHAVAPPSLHLNCERALTPIRRPWVMNSPKLSGDPRASAMQERAAVADVCPKRRRP
jgi:hypothetical protein